MRLQCEKSLRWMIRNDGASLMPYSDTKGFWHWVQRRGWMNTDPEEIDTVHYWAIVIDVALELETCRRRKKFAKMFTGKNK